MKSSKTIIKNINKNINNINIKKIFSSKNSKILIKIVSLLILAWIILYAAPELFLLLFNTFLGKLILILTVIIVGISNYKYGIILAAVLVIIYRSYVLSSQTEKEGFTWTQDEITNFITIQNTTNPHIVYNTNTLQKYASSDEVDSLLKNGIWPWSTEVQNLYTDALLKNPFVRVYKTDGLNSAMQVYNEKAIKYILKGQEEKEKQQKQKVIEKKNLIENENELPSGWGSFGYNSGLIPV